MAKLAERVSDKRMLKLIRAFLTAGVMENGLVGPVDEGTPQGGPLSPLWSMTGTGSWSSEDCGLRGMRTIATFTFVASGQGNG